MKITRENYEVFFIDYLDGTLGPSGKAALNDFLDNNPDLRNELDEFEGLLLDPDETEYSWKKELKKETSEGSSVNAKNFDRYCIAKVEGDLEPAEEYDAQMVIAVAYWEAGGIERVEAVYREAISDARLRAVTEHIRRWLFGEEENH